MKNHPFFGGIDWEQVAKGEFIPSYEPNELQIDYENPKELAKLFHISADDNLDADLVERFRSKFLCFINASYTIFVYCLYLFILFGDFSFVAPQHRN